MLKPDSIRGTDPKSPVDPSFLRTTPEQEGKAYAVGGGGEAGDQDHHGHRRKETGGWREGHSGLEHTSEESLTHPWPMDPHVLTFSSTVDSVSQSHPAQSFVGPL